MAISASARSVKVLQLFFEKACPFLETKTSDSDFYPFNFRGISTDLSGVMWLAGMSGSL